MSPAVPHVLVDQLTEWAKQALCHPEVTLVAGPWRSCHRTLAEVRQTRSPPLSPAPLRPESLFQLTYKLDGMYSRFIIFPYK